MSKTLVLLFWSGLLAGPLHGQGHPLMERFQRLMGDPKELVGQLLNYPWRPELPAELPGLPAVPAPSKIRIASIEQNLSDVATRKRWQSEDRKLWVDLIAFTSPGRAVGTIQTARQPHSGYIWANQLLLFSATGDAEREALGATVALANGTLLNIGMALPVAVNWKAPLSSAELASFDAALTRFHATLDILGRALLDPNYVTLGSKIEPKSDALAMLRIAGFARLWSYVKYNFVYLDRRPGLNWEGVLERYLPSIAAAKDDTEYGRILQRAMALLQDGHSGVYPNVVTPRDSPAILLESIGDKPVATVVGDLEELTRIKPGMELIEIDGRHVNDVIERDVDPYIFSSTPQDRKLRQTFAVLEGPPGSIAKTKWLSLDGRTIDVAIPRNRSQHRGALKIPSRPRLEHRELAGGVAYIALNSFEHPAINSDFDAKFDQLRGAKAWIIDLRNNGGGSSDIGYKILARLIDAPVNGSKQSTRLYNPTLAARNQSQPWYDWEADVIAPTAIEARYQGPVYVLTSPATCSAAEDFLIPLRAAKRITIIGEPSCGSTGHPLSFSIYGATARVCTKWDRFPDGTEFVGTGVIPDVKAARTKADVSAGRDAVLEAAIALASR